MVSGVAMSPLLYATLLTLHIGGGSIAILSGAAAITVAKGEHLHRVFGTVFVAAMLTMATAAVCLATLIGQKGNILAGSFAFYFVVSAWMTVRRKDGALGRYESFALLVPLAIAAIAFTFGLWAAASPKGLDGYSPVLYFGFAALASLAGILDLRVVLRGSLSGVQRIARHIWRMCFAFFIAAGSFFIGQQKVMPAFMHGSRILLALGFAPLVLMVFWLIRVRIGKRFKSQAVAA
jgi:uncharacterized membrane protein